MHAAAINPISATARRRERSACHTRRAKGRGAVPVLDALAFESTTMFTSSTRAYGNARHGTPEAGARLLPSSQGTESGLHGCMHAAMGKPSPGETQLLCPVRFFNEKQPTGPNQRPTAPRMLNALPTDRKAGIGHSHAWEHVGPRVEPFPCPLGTSADHVNALPGAANDGARPRGRSSIVKQASCLCGFGPLMPRSDR